MSKNNELTRYLQEIEYSSHLCTPEFKGVKHLPMDYWWQTRTEQGEDLLIIKGLDGFLYRFRAVTGKIFDYFSPGIALSDGKKHEEFTGQSDKDETEPKKS